MRFAYLTIVIAFLQEQRTGDCRPISLKHACQVRIGIHEGKQPCVRGRNVIVNQINNGSPLNPIWEASITSARPMEEILCTTSLCIGLKASPEDSLGAINFDNT